MFAIDMPDFGSVWHKLTFSWFDGALICILVFAFWRGRKRGMTKELMPTVKWVSILLVAGLCHPFLADYLEQAGYVRKVFGNTFREHTAALLTAYLSIGLVLFIFFTVLGRKINPKIEGSNFFGGNEYYWGVVAGLVRYVSLILVALALLNAPLYSQADIEAAKAYNNRWFGGGQKDFSGDFIPSVYEVQDNVFKKSLVGSLIKDNLSILLINPAPAYTKTAHS
jgi:uncharacterized membrane protein required for colicin V production